MSLGWSFKLHILQNICAVKSGPATLRWLPTPFLQSRDCRHDGPCCSSCLSVWAENDHCAAGMYLSRYLHSSPLSFLLTGRPSQTSLYGFTFLLNTYPHQKYFIYWFVYYYPLPTPSHSLLLCLSISTRTGT